MKRIGEPYLPDEIRAKQAEQITQQLNPPEKPDHGEPWEEHSTWDEVITVGNDHVIFPASDIPEKYKTRILVCVNACAGMADPVAEIQAMRDAIKDAYEALLRVSECKIFYAESMDIDNHTTDDCASALAKLKPFLK